ncbi:hypothetical protein [Helicobacter winghamensis]|uniref:hypothetical protein n=1 Tax=Helicobacter winghamensis TaxID=157268 RepID=UPI0027A70324
MDFGISYIPVEGQSGSAPKDPIKKKNYITKEEAQALVDEKISESESKINESLQANKSEMENRCNELISESEARMETKCNELIQNAMGSSEG